MSPLPLAYIASSPGSFIFLSNYAEGRKKLFFFFPLPSAYLKRKIKRPGDEARLRLNSYSCMVHDILLHAIAFAERACTTLLDLYRHTVEKACRRVTASIIMRVYRG